MVYRFNVTKCVPALRLITVDGIGNESYVIYYLVLQAQNREGVTTWLSTERAILAGGCFWRIPRLKNVLL